MRIFLSAVSAQFQACRDELASDLRAIGHEVRVQEDFQQGPGTLIQKLEAYVAGCDRVIAVIGEAFGYEGTGVPVPGGGPARSYSQWEYFFAQGERLDGSRAAPKPTYVYMSADGFGAPITQSADHAERQRQFRAQVKASGKDRNTFGSADELCRRVLRDGWQIEHRPRRPRNLPFGTLGDLFKGRDAFVEDLHRRLQRHRSRTAAIVSKQAIHGLGGVGKTRLAIEYALRYQAEYSALLFITGDSPEALRRNLAALCSSDVLDLPEKEAKEEQARTQAALRWLHEHSGWLLIVDNVDTKEAAKAVEGTIGPLGEGHVLVTARVSSWSASVEKLELDVLEEDHAVAFLLARTEGSRQTTATDEADARALAKQVGGLAVALEQAGAYISELRLSLAEYLRLWNEGNEKVRDWNDETLTKYPRAALVTWDISFSELAEPARQLLQHILCWLAPDPIPRFLLETDVVRSVLSVDPMEALTGLARLSLVKWEHGNHAFRLHRLVQEVTRDRLTDQQRKFGPKITGLAVNAALPAEPPPEDPRSWARWEPLRPHIVAMSRPMEKEKTSPIGARTRLLNDLALVLRTKGIWHEAEPLATQMLAEAEAAAAAEGAGGLERQNLFVSLTGLGSLLRDTGRLSEAEPHYRRALKLKEAEGYPSRDLSAALNNLALLLVDRNRAAEAKALLDDGDRLREAEALLRRAWEIDEQLFGPDHQEVATDIQNLAHILKFTKRSEEAETLVRRALDIFEREFQGDHPDVAQALNNLSLLLLQTNRLEEAEARMKRALGMDERILGPNHPKIATRLNNLAEILRAQGRAEDALPLMKRGLEILLIAAEVTGHRSPMFPVVARNYRALLRVLGRSESEQTANIESLARAHGIDPAIVLNP